MKGYYMLLGLNQKEIKIIDVKEKDGIIEVSIENKKNDVRNVINLLRTRMGKIKLL